MNYKEERSRITIAPTDPVEEAYLELVFGLKKEGDECVARRKNASGLSCWAYLEILPKDKSSWTPNTLAEHLTNCPEKDVPPWVRTFIKSMMESYSTAVIVAGEGLSKLELKAKMEEAVSEADIPKMMALWALLEDSVRD